MKLCKDCKHCRPAHEHDKGFFIRRPSRWTWEFARCAAEHCTEPVAGYGGDYCDIQRKFARDGYCGREARFFEPKENA